jgi:hypothetical protein
MTNGMELRGRGVMILESWGVVVGTTQWCITAISINPARDAVYLFQLSNTSLQSSILPENSAYYTILDVAWTNSSSW